MKFWLMVLILTIAFFLRIYRLDELMPFIGDFAWFYISARDMLLTGQIPLVGITSSHTWVHQGPLWTYLLAIPLFISNFNPLSGVYLTAILGTITVFLIYKLGSQMFSRFVGLTAAVLYATSPLVIIHSRMPYHTSLIPLVVLLSFLFLYKWIKGDIRYLPFVFLTLGILYNLELATMVFWILIFLIFVYGFIKKEKWFTKALKLKVVLLSFFLFLLSMSPMLVYDFKENTGYYQTTAFFRLIKIYLFSSNNTFSFEAMQNVFSSLFIYNQRLVFLGNGALASMLTIVSLVYLIVRHSGNQAKPETPEPLRALHDKGDSGQARMTESRLLLVLWVVIPLCGILISKTASEAYLPMIFPAMIFSIAFFFNYVYKRHVFIAVTAIILVTITNSYLLITKNYLMGTAGGYGLPFSERVSKAQELIKKSKGREYNLIGQGKGSEHKSFTMNYEYLTWWLGHSPSKKPERLKFVIKE